MVRRLMVSWGVVPGGGLRMSVCQWVMACEAQRSGAPVMSGVGWVLAAVVMAWQRV